MRASLLPAARPGRLARLVVRAAALGLATALGACALVPYFSGELSMSAADLTARMAKRFPQERSMAGLVESKIDAPWVTLDEARNRIAVDFKLTVKLALSTKQLQGSVKVSGRPDFDPATRALYLRDAKVDQVRFEDMSDTMAAVLTKAASSLARDTMDNKPLHVFKPEDFNRSGVAFEPEQLVVRGDRLVLKLKK